MHDDFSHLLKDNHFLGFGGTRKGKSMLLQLMLRSIIKRGYEGVTYIDPHGEGVRELYAWLANPMHGIAGRRVHLLDPGSAYTFGLNPLMVPDNPTWEQCHDAAQTLTSVIEARFGQSAEETPRMAKIIYIAAMLCARKNLTVVELVELLSVGSHALRDSLLTDFDNTIVRSELQDLFLLAQTRPERFIEYVESTKNRMVRLLGDPRMRRILGQRRGIDPKSIMDGRDILLVDLSSLDDADGSFIATLISSLYYTYAKRRPPRRCALHRLAIDEAERALTPVIARTADQLAKYGLLMILFLQRLGQLRAKGDFIADALATNCNIKACFGGLQHESSEWIARMFFSGFIDMAEWVPGSERPVVVGHEKHVTYNRSRGEQTAEHKADHEATADTTARSSSSGHAATASRSSSFGSGSGHSDSAAFAMQPAAGFFMPSPTPGQPNSWIEWDGLNGQSIGAADMRSSFESEAAGTAESDSVSESESESTSASYGTSRGVSRGTSLSEGEAEVFVAKLEWMPSKIYSHDDQIHRLTGEIMNLPRRELFLKLEGQRPVRMRTRDVEPSFTSPEFRSAMLPVFERAMIAKSSVLVPVAIADKEIAARAASLVPPAPAEPDPQTRDPLPGVAALRDIIATASPPEKPKPKAKPPKSPPRPKRGGRPTLVVFNDHPQPPEDPAA